MTLYRTPKISAVWPLHFLNICFRNILNVYLMFGLIFCDMILHIIVIMILEKAVVLSLNRYEWKYCSLWQAALRGHGGLGVAESESGASPDLRAGLGHCDGSCLPFTFIFISLVLSSAFSLGMSWFLQSRSRFTFYTFAYQDSFLCLYDFGQQSFSSHCDSVREFLTSEGFCPSWFV